MKCHDDQHQSYIHYPMNVIIIVRLLGDICCLNSIRKLTDTFNTNECIENIAQLVGITLEEIPHYDTITMSFVTLILRIFVSYKRKSSRNLSVQKCLINIDMRVSYSVKFRNRIYLHLFIVFISIFLIIPSIFIFTLQSIIEG